MPQDKRDLEKEKAVAQAKAAAARMASGAAQIEERQKRARKRPAKRVYVVKSGDSLSKIAAEVYGDADRWQEIFEANKD